MPKLVKATPKYRKHKASGQGVVTIDGRDIYLGPHRSTASRREYDRIIGEWLAGGRAAAVAPDAFTILELCAAFWRHAKVHYTRPDGLPSAAKEPNECTSWVFQ